MFHCSRDGDCSHGGRRRAVVAVQVLVALPVLVGFAAITVDVGIMYNARTDLQRAADAAALAAVAEFAYAAEDVDPSAAAIAAAADLVDRNPVLGRALSLDTNTGVVFGRAYYDEFADSYSFVPGDAPTNAVRIVVRQTDDSPNGPLPLHFAGVLGRSVTNVSATSVALFVQSCFEEGDCYDVPSEGNSIMCHYGDSDDSDDSASGDSDDSDDSQPGDSDGSHDGDSDDSDDSQGEFGDPDSDDSDDSAGADSDDSSDSTDSGEPVDSDDSGDSESADSEADSDAGRTIIVNTNAVPLFLQRGDTLGACGYCPEGDSDDSDDSQGEFGDPDSSDSDDSDPGDSDGSENGDSDDSDDSQGEFGDPDSDDSDDSDPGVFYVTICHIPPGNPDNAHAITVRSPALPAHLAHGDTLGVCPDDNGSETDSGTTANCLGSTRVFLIE